MKMNVANNVNNLLVHFVSAVAGDLSHKRGEGGGVNRPL